MQNTSWYRKSGGVAAHRRAGNEDPGQQHELAAVPAIGRSQCHQLGGL